MNDKIVQIAATPDTESEYAKIIALTKNGRLFLLPLSPNGEWEEVGLPDDELSE